MQTLSPRFGLQQFFLCKICGEAFSPDLERFVCHPDGHQHGGRKPTETSVTEFRYKSVNLALEEVQSNKIKLFSKKRTAQIAKFSELSPVITHFLTNSTVMKMPRHAKA